MTLTHTVAPDQDGMMLRSLLRHDLNLSAAAIKKAKYGGIRINGQVVTLRSVLSSGDTVTVELREDAPALMPESGTLSVLYEDEYLLAVDKPAGILCHPNGKSGSGSLENLALGYLGAGAAAHLAGRLDRDTRGVVLFAKNAHVKARLLFAAKDGGIIKRYEGVVWGSPPDEGEISFPIARREPPSTMRFISPDGKSALTKFKVLRRWDVLGGSAAYLSFRLMTGRTHQIRVHCLYSGFPLLGDRMYYTPQSLDVSEELGLYGQLLICRSLSLSHPLTGKALEIVSKQRI